jgi:hypothetical protein
VVAEWVCCIAHRAPSCTPCAAERRHRMIRPIVILSSINPSQPPYPTIATSLTSRAALADAVVHCIDSTRPPQPQLQQSLRRLAAVPWPLTISHQELVECWCVWRPSRPSLWRCRPPRPPLLPLSPPRLHAPRSRPRPPGAFLW